MAFHYIYIIKNTINNKFYIGKRTCHCPVWKDKYMGSGVYLIKAQNKYGIENFEKEVIEICETEQKAYERERYWINKYNAVENDKFYNLVDGGHGFTSKDNKRIRENMTLEQIQEWNRKVGESHKGKKLSGEHKKKLSESHKGKKISEETKKKLSEAKKGENNPMYGKKFSEEYKKKLSQVHKGKTLSEETKKKLSQVHKGRQFSEESKRKMKENNARARKIVCITTGEIFNCINEASRKYNVSNQNISACCRGKRKTTGKLATGERLIWKYVEEI